MKPDVAGDVEKIRAHWEQSQRVLVSGPTGSGIHTVARALSADAQTTVVELRDPDDSDAASSLLLEVAATLAAPERERIIERLNDGEAAQVAAKALTDADGSVVLLLPASTPRRDERRSLERLRRTLAAFSRVQRLAVLGPTGLDASAFGVSIDAEVVLRAPSVQLDPAIFPEGLFREAATQLRGRVHNWSASPLVWRLAVGAVALGAPDVEVARITEDVTPRALQVVTGLVAERVKQQPQLWAAMRALLAARRPLPLEEVETLTGVAAQHLPLLTHCVGYDEPLRVSRVVRELLKPTLASNTSDEEIHARYANHYRMRDGVASPSQIKTPGQMSAWIERVHHVSQTGNVEEWNSLELPAPEFYWQRGRHLSINRHDFVAAAEVFSRCAKKFPKDAYSAEYAAWNRWQAGERSPAVCKQYKQAVELDESNPWWNQRWISALIDLGALREARQAWVTAIGRIDGDGTISTRDTWLLENLYVPVARAWLRADCWHDALRTLGPVRRVFSEHSELRELTEAIENSKAKVWSQLYAFLREREREGSQWANARSFVDKLRDVFPALPVPSSGDGEDGAARLEWNQDDQIVFVDVGVGDSLYWYARHRPSGISTDGDQSRTAPLGEDLDQWLGGVASA